MTATPIPSPAAAERTTPPGRARNRASAATIERIILEAERLFAEHGIDRISLREIAVAAGQKNTNSVNYHFGDREGLVQAIKHHYTIQFEPMRQRMLDAAAAHGRGDDIRALLETLVLPYLSVASGGAGHSYVSFISQVLSRKTGHSDFYPYDDLQADVVPACRTLLVGLRQRLIWLPEEPFRYRLRAAIAIFVNAVQAWDSLQPIEPQSQPLDAVIMDALSQMTAAITAPFDHRGQTALLNIALDPKGDRRGSA